MIRPVNFGFNTETAVNNAFQVAGQEAGAQARAEKEFDEMVSLLRSHGISVTVVQDTPQPYTPDSIFPNNWISFHEDGSVVLYPMFALNRRAERKPQVLNTIFSRFAHSALLDLSEEEKHNRFLEGTGSMVLDRENRIAYACLSPRTDSTVLQRFCEKMQYRPMAFTATDASQQLIYHTNVMMCVADRFVVICLDAIRDPSEKEKVISCIRSSGKELIVISFAQMNAFAGNMLQVQNAAGEKFLVMSSRAHASLEPEQRKKLETYNPILHADLYTIETNGGGSARCMMAEVYLPLLQSPQVIQ